MDIGVFCSARDIGPEYTEPVQDFARHVGENGHTLVWGGSNSGLMRLVAEEVRAAGGKLVGVSMPVYEEEAFVGADELLIAADLFDRKRLMIERSEAIAILVGGIGTLDEATDIIEFKREGMHDVPLVILNTDGFYDPLRDQLALMEKAGFLDRPASELVDFAATSHEALDLMVAKAGLST